MFATPKPLAITGWDVISPIGIGKQSFVTGLQHQSSGLKRRMDDVTDPPPINVHSIPEFDTVKFLGAKGTRSIDRTTALSIAAAGMALETRNLSEASNRDRIGVVLGTSTGSLKSIGDFVQEMHVQQKPYLVNPATFPNIVLNCAASQTAIRYGLKGINATVSGGQLSMILALRYAYSKIAKGYSDSLVTGSVEELSEQSAWSYYHNKFSALQSAPGEGCAMFLLEDLDMVQQRGITPMAELLSSEVRVYPVKSAEELGRSQAKGLATCITAALRKANLTPDAIDAVSTLKCWSSSIEHIQTESLRMVFGDAAPRHHIAVGELVGDCFSASGAFQLAALLSLPQLHQLTADSYGLMLSAQADGLVGCAVFKIRRTDA